MTEAGDGERQTRELLQASLRLGDTLLGCSEDHVLAIDAGIGDEQDTSIATPMEGDLASAVARNVMRAFYAILFAFALSTPTMAQTISNENGTSIPNDGILKPSSSANKRVDRMDGRVPLPCDGELDQHKRCAVRFSGSHLF